MPDVSDEREIPDIQVGTVFSTPFESNCVALSKPDRAGNFTAKDSDGVECEFNIVMVTEAWKQVRSGRAA